MSDRVSELIAQAKAMTEAATQAPWWWTNESRRRLMSGRAKDNLTAAGEVFRCGALAHPEAADAEFIAWCRNNVSALVEALDEARAHAAWYAAERDYITTQAEVFGYGEFRVTRWAYDRVLAVMYAAKDERDRARAALARVEALPDELMNDAASSDDADWAFGVEYGADVIRRAMKGEAS